MRFWDMCWKQATPDEEAEIGDWVMVHCCDSRTLPTPMAGCVRRIAGENHVLVHIPAMGDGVVWSDDWTSLTPEELAKHQLGTAGQLDSL